MSDAKKIRTRATSILMPAIMWYEVAKSLRLGDFDVVEEAGDDQQQRWRCRPTWPRRLVGRRTRRRPTALLPAETGGATTMRR